MRCAWPILLLAPLVSGCLVRTAADVATLPVKAGAKAVDWTTTSQSEADRNRGRAERKAEKRAAKERRKAERACARDPAQCDPPSEMPPPQR